MLSQGVATIVFGVSLALYQGWQLALLGMRGITGSISGVAISIVGYEGYYWLYIRGGN